MNEKVEPEIREIIPKEYYAIASPKILIENALERAKILSSVIRDRKLYVSIQGREFVQVEGWTLLGQMCGIYPVLVFTRQEGEGYVSYVELRTRGGEVVGAAQGYCGRDEKQWQNKPAHQLISMSQTRATSKALRISLGYIMRLAGYEPKEVKSEERFCQEQAQSNSHPPVQQAEGSEVNYHRGAFGIFHKLRIATSAEQPLRKRIYRTLFGKEANLTNEEWKQVFEFVKDIESKEDLISELERLEQKTGPEPESEPYNPFDDGELYAIIAPYDETFLTIELQKRDYDFESWLRRSGGKWSYPLKKWVFPKEKAGDLAQYFGIELAKFFSNQPIEVKR